MSLWVEVVNLFSQPLVSSLLAGGGVPQYATVVDEIDQLWSNTCKDKATETCQTVHTPKKNITPFLRQAYFKTECQKLHLFWTPVFFSHFHWKCFKNHLVMLMFRLRKKSEKILVE